MEQPDSATNMQFNAPTLAAVKVAGQKDSKTELNQLPLLHGTKGLFRNEKQNSVETSEAEAGSQMR